MKKSKSNFYFFLILLVHILVYFFKIDRDVFAFEEYIRHPHQTYIEQPLSKNASCFGSSISEFSPFLKSLGAENNSIEYNPAWRSIFLSYNSRVHHLLILHGFFPVPTIGIILILHRQNVSHKSSEDEGLSCRFFA